MNLQSELVVRKGCVLWALLFNLYSEDIFTKALENGEGEIPVNGIPLNNLRYADDTVLLAENMSDLDGTKLKCQIRISMWKTNSWKESRAMTTWGKCQLFCGLLFRNKDSH